MKISFLFKKMLKLKKILFNRITYILIITFILSSYIFPTPHYDLLTKAEEGKVSYQIDLPPDLSSVSKETFDPTNPIGILWHIIYYRSKPKVICFEIESKVYDVTNPFERRELMMGELFDYIVQYEGETFRVEDRECRKIIYHSSREINFSEDFWFKLDFSRNTFVEQLTKNPPYVKPGIMRWFIKVIFLSFISSAVVMLIFSVRDFITFGRFNKKKNP